MRTAHVKPALSHVTALTSDRHDKINLTLELDSHADTCILGQGALIINDYCKHITVYAYDTSLPAKTYKLVSGVLGYFHPKTHKLYHLVLHQAIHMPHLEHSLLNPLQCRVNSIAVNDVPKFLRTCPTDEDHAIVVPDPDNPQSKLCLPLSLNGVFSYLPVQPVTEDEWKLEALPRIELTNEHLTWDPYHNGYADQEDATTDNRGSVIPRV